MRRRLSVCAAAALVAVLVLLGIAQLVLPSIAAHEIRARLDHSGHVSAVSVHAFPAVELLWHHADRVTIRMSSYTASNSGLQGNLGQVTQVGTLAVSAQTVRIDGLALQDVTMTKRGGALSGAATVTEQALRNAVPLLQSVTPVASVDGQLTLRGTASLLGLSASVDVALVVHDHGLVLTPDVPLGGLVAITVFSDPRLAVTGVSAHTVSGGFRLAATGVVR